MEEKDRRILRLVGALSTVGITLVATTVIGYFVGHWLDGKFKTDPWLTVVFLLFGIAAGFKNLFEQAKKVQHADDADRKDEHDS